MYLSNKIYNNVTVTEESNQRWKTFPLFRLSHNYCPNPIIFQNDKQRRIHVHCMCCVFVFIYFLPLISKKINMLL